MANVLAALAALEEAERYLTKARAVLERAKPLMTPAQQDRVDMAFDALHNATFDLTQARLNS